MERTRLQQGFSAILGRCRILPLIRTKRGRLRRKRQLGRLRNDASRTLHEIRREYGIGFRMKREYRRIRILSQPQIGGRFVFENVTNRKLRHPHHLTHVRGVLPYGSPP